MELKQMKYLLCLAEEGHVTRAARRLHIVQPALSMQIARLEAEFGRKLFNRTRHGVSLTPAGATLVQLVAPIVRDADRATDEMARLDGRVSGRVRIGLITSVAQTTVASFSAKVAKQFPDVQLSVCEGYTEVLLDWVTTGEIDAALVNVPRHKLALSSTTLLEEEMVFAYRAGSNIVLPKRLRFEDVARYNLVTPSKRHGLRLILDNRAAEVGIELKPKLEVDTLHAIAEVVATTDLVTILPSIALAQMLASGRICGRLFAAPGISRAIAAVHDDRRVLSAATSAVIDIIKDDLVAAAARTARYVTPKRRQSK